MVVAVVHGVPTWAGDDTSTAAGVAASGPQSRGWSARLPAQDKIDYRGAVNFDAAGSGAGAMMYPVPGIAGLLVAIATHAVIVNSVRSNEKSKIQLEADKVLTPYQAALSSYDQRTLFQRALEKTRSGLARSAIEVKAPSGGRWIVESAPVFFMTQDQQALVLENTIAVFAPDSAPLPVYQNLVRVVSSAEPADDIPTRWNADDGRRLKEASAELLARSLDIAIDAAVAPAAEASVPQHTFRYLEGGHERMERAQLVSAGCGQMVLRTLRGWLMSVPIKSADAKASAASCAGPDAAAPATAAAPPAPAPGASGALGLAVAR